MKRYDLNKNWEYLESNLQNPLMVGILQGWKKTDLPHDYATEKPRDPNAPNGPDEGYMPSGRPLLPQELRRRAAGRGASGSGWSLRASLATPRSGSTKSWRPSILTPTPVSGPR